MRCLYFPLGVSTVGGVFEFSHLGAALSFFYCREKLRPHFDTFSLRNPTVNCFFVFSVISDLLKLMKESLSAAVGVRAHYPARVWNGFLSTKLSLVRFHFSEAAGGLR